jgi:hypothetical protein
MALTSIDFIAVVSNFFSQIKSGEENVNFLKNTKSDKTNQEATSAPKGEDKFTVSDLDFIPPPPYEVC